ncbi:hypothetical protein ACJRO7_019382 [Eucalyptus globulus]|uniref:Uncharacterized protein n=1 Tax=Eucalyptus globulus TaxID=34317 RepID=A0ABD3KG90_EUCGL
MEKGQAKASALVIILVIASGFGASQAAEERKPCLQVGDDKADLCPVGYHPIVIDLECFCVPSQRQDTSADREGNGGCSPKLCPNGSRTVFAHGTCFCVPSKRPDVSVNQVGGGACNPEMCRDGFLPIHENDECVCVPWERKH